MGPRAVDDVGLAGLEGGEAPLDVVGAHAEVGVDEDAGAPGGGSMPARTAAPLPRLLGQPHDPRARQPELADGRLDHLGGAVAAAVVDEDELEALVEQPRGLQRLERAPMRVASSYIGMTSDRWGGGDDRSFRWHERGQGRG